MTQGTGWDSGLVASCSGTVRKKTLFCAALLVVTLQTVGLCLRRLKLGRAGIEQGLDVVVGVLQATQEANTCLELCGQVWFVYMRPCDCAAVQAPGLAGTCSVHQRPLQSLMLVVMCPSKGCNEWRTWDVTVRGRKCRAGWLRMIQPAVAGLSACGYCCVLIRHVHCVDRGESMPQRTRSLPQYSASVCSTGLMLQRPDA